MRRTPLVLILTLTALGTTAEAADLTLTTGGRVSVELVFSAADFSNTLALTSPAGAVIVASGCQLEPANGLGGLFLLSEKRSQRGCRVELDADGSTGGIQPFSAGDTLSFSMCAQTDADDDCEFLWSSNPASNSDSFDHVITTDVYSTDFPGMVFELAWEDLENGGDLDFDDIVANVRVGGDADGDALWDDWETFGIDADADGLIDLDLPALGADPQKKDLFLEIDYMDCAVAGGDCASGDTHSHRPLGDAIDAVVAAFANAPVSNPDGSTGIALHIDVSNAIPHQDALNIPGLCFSGGAGIGDFDAVKADPANFGTNNPRRFAYRYGLYTHQQISGNTTSGCGELPGNDFQVSLGGWTLTAQVDAGTLMHEFGHNLNLFHGGNENRNRKPNYISVMSYAFQTRGIPPTDPDGTADLTARVDYSGTVLASLNENSLSEAAGINDGTDNTRYFCSGAEMVGSGNSPIDWNCDGDTADGSVSGDINNDGVTGTLNGHDDWSNIDFTFHTAGDFDDGEHSFSTPVTEVDLPTHLAIPLELRIDLKPDTLTNVVNPRSRGNLPVAILSTDDFDAPAEVDTSTLTFGRTGHEDSLRKCVVDQVDDDGLSDLLCHFRTVPADLAMDSTRVTLRGETFAGEAIVGVDQLMPVPSGRCGLGFEIAPILLLAGRLRRRSRRSAV